MSVLAFWGVVLLALVLAATALHGLIVADERGSTDDDELDARAFRCWLCAGRLREAAYLHGGLKVLCRDCHAIGATREVA